MAEEILVLMADLDDESQKIMGGWYDKLRAEGFTGVQTQGLPFHISLGKITRLHLCAFWPTREIAAVYLKDKQEDTI